ncbi:MAG: mycofactocin biosynthesis glycosyltransferase MftF [Thermomicrobium sp.]|nr:mycofactocin biosynthesis glycosyltransferase MftF [Thermomicrobium sp.]MDW7983023.1 mycofactocin biosynthesis glycosyltransferase MftF [Thermomicrobium sp.]
MTARARLDPHVRWVEDGAAVWIVAERPLRMWRVHPRVARLLDALRQNPDVEQALRTVPALSRETAFDLLERFSDEGLLQLEWLVPEDDLPAVTVVIPVRNRPRQIEACLAALERLDYPRDRLEVIVVDDASTDETVQRVEPWVGRLPLRLVRMPIQVGAAACRNQGAEQARGELVAFTDSDCRPHPRWLCELVPEFVRPSVVAVGGAVLPVDERNWLDRYEAVESPLTHGPAPARVQPRGAVPYLVTANMLVRRRALLDAGGFARIHPGEDVDLVWRFCAQGWRVLYRPHGVVYHDHRDRLWPFLRRRAAYATSEVVLVGRHPEYRHRLTLPMAVLASGAMVFAARRWRWFGPLALLPLFADLASALRTVRGTGAPIGVRTVVAAEARGTAAALYWVGRTISRYWSGPALVAGALTGRWSAGRWLLALAVTSLVGTALVDGLRHRPRLDLLRFVVAHVLDDLANNVGLLAGCVRERTVRALRIDVALYWPRQRRRQGHRA